MTVILLDGRNMLYRFGYVFLNLKDEKGRSTGAVYGVLKCLIRLKRKYPDARFVMVWDGEGKSWRHELFPEYKSNRHSSGRSDPNDHRYEILSQEKVLRTVGPLIGVQSFSKPGVEADDLLAFFSVHVTMVLGERAIIYSSDKDFLQLMQYGVELIRDKDKENKLRVTTEKDIMDEFGCKPEDVLKIRILSGDHSDCIPNVLPKLGPKTALKLIKAGVDPTKHDVRQGAAGNKELAAVWPAVVRNRVLMRLQRSYVELWEPFKEALTGLPRNYNGLLQFLIEHDMLELLEDRHELYTVQKE